MKNKTATKKSSTVSSATKQKVARDIKAENAAKLAKAEAAQKAKAPKKTIGDNPKYKAVLELILNGASPSECNKALACRRSFARRILKAELTKLGAPYTITSRIKNGKAITVEAASRTRKSKETAEPIDLGEGAPVRFESREIEGGTAVFDTVTGLELQGCRSRNDPTTPGDVCRLADLFVTLSSDDLKEVAKAAPTADNGFEKWVAKAVIKLLATPVPAEAKSEEQPQPDLLSA